MRSMPIILTVLVMITLSIGIMGMDARAEDGSITANAEDDNGIWEWIQDFLTQIINAFISLITAPFRAISSIFGNWANTLTHWYGPIVAVFVLAVCYFMIRAVTEFDEWLDLNN